MAGAGGHGGRLEDDGVAAGGEPHRHLLVEYPTGSLEEERRGGGGALLKIRTFHFLFHSLTLLTFYFFIDLY